MKINVVSRPAAAVARVEMSRGETLVCEAGSMVAMSREIHVETTSRNRSGGGILRGVRRMFAGEGFFLNHFTAAADGQELIIGPDLVGDVVHHTLRGGDLIIQGQSWLAASTGIDVDMTWQGVAASLFSGETMFWVRCSGEGDVLFNSYGAIYEVDVRDNYVVDTGHIVAFENTLQFRIGRATRSLIGTFLSGEGLVCKFSGRGKLYCQTHDPDSFGRLLGPRLKAREE